MNKILARAVIAAALLGTTALHANSLVGSGPRSNIAKSSIAATPDGEWNKLSRVDGANIEVWTRDGDNLNKVSFFGGLASGTTLYRERDKKNAPLPRIVKGMLLPDIPVLLESTYRSQYKVNRISIDTQEATKVNGKDAIRFTYTYVRNEDEVERKGEAIGSIAGDKLYLVTYEAPAIYYFDRDLANYRQIVSTLKF